MTVHDHVHNEKVAALLIVVSPMRRRHLRGVLRIEEVTSSTPWSLGLFLAESRRTERVYLVAKSGAKVVGYAGLLLVLGEGHITTVAVDPEVQGGRIGTRLMLVLLRRAVDEGAEAITLEVRASNAAALAMYRRFGFIPSGARKNYYSNPVEDALVLWAHDVHTVSYAERLSSIEESLKTPLVFAGLSMDGGTESAEPDDYVTNKIELDQNELDQNELDQNELDQNELDQNELDQNELDGYVTDEYVSDGNVSDGDVSTAVKGYL